MGSTLIPMLGPHFQGLVGRQPTNLRGKHRLCGLYRDRVFRAVRAVDEGKAPRGIQCGGFYAVRRPVHPVRHRVVFLGCKTEPRANYSLFLSSKIYRRLRRWKYQKF